MENREDTKVKLELSLDNYIDDENSICREERQYALFLCNILKKYGKYGIKSDKNKQWSNNVIEDLKEIFNICGIPEDAVIKNVFYEVTFMRDIFSKGRNLEKQYVKSKKRGNTVSVKNYAAPEYEYNENFNNKKMEYEDDGIENKSFNKRLLKYLGLDIKDKKFSDIPEVNIGHNLHNKILDSGNIFDKDEIKKLETAKFMMNSKPDIAVIYSSESEDERIKDISEEKEKRVYLLFLECKFESKEDKIKFEDGERIKQTSVQYKIAEFICQNFMYSQKENIKLYVADRMKNKYWDLNGGASVKVEFTRSVNSKNNRCKADKQIYIKKLIELNEKIFS